MKTSESIKNISEALAAFNAEIKDPRREATNPHFNSKYVSLDALVSTVRPCLSKHGLAIMQSGSGDGAVITVTTRIQHTSGEWIESDPLPLKVDKLTPQGAGSAMTYGRRYSLSAMLNLAWCDNDDDGEIADGRGDSKNYFTNPAEVILENLQREMGKNGINPNEMPDIIKKFKGNPCKWNDLTMEEQMTLIQKLPQLKG